MIGKDLSLKIRQDMSKQLITGSTIKNKNGVTLSLCPFCTESKSNCVILLCGHLICNKCAKNINRCKYPHKKNAMQRIRKEHIDNGTVKGHSQPIIVHSKSHKTKSEKSSAA